MTYVTGQPNTAEEKIQGPGGLGIFVRSWQPATPPRAVVVICHDFDKERVMSDILQWLDARVPQA